MTSIKRVRAIGGKNQNVCGPILLIKRTTHPLGEKIGCAMGSGEFFRNIKEKKKGERKRRDGRKSWTRCVTAGGSMIQWVMGRGRVKFGGEKGVGNKNGLGASYQETKKVKESAATDVAEGHGGHT